jgi:phosphate transport system protein
LKAESLTLFKEDVLAIGQAVDRMVDETGRILRGAEGASLSVVQEYELKVNRSNQEIEEKCLDLLRDKDLLAEKDLRMLVVSTIISAKFERMADHAHRVAKIGAWAHEDGMDMPPELIEMAKVVHRMVQDVLLLFLSEASDKAYDILKRDSEVDYLDAVLSKKLLSNLGDQDRAHAQMRAQFLFSSRFLERMGDLCTSIAKRIYFIVTGERIKGKTEASGTT